MSEIVQTIEQYARKHAVEDLVKDSIRKIFKELPESPVAALHEEFAKKASAEESSAVSMATAQDGTWLTLVCKSSEDSQYVKAKDLHSLVCQLAAEVVHDKPEDVTAALLSKLAALQQKDHTAST